ncbi:chromate transporter [Mycoplasmopsis agassizii]|uniref:Chromate transporter n=1 Tax=Mycoplasmopsis agassizii TaxID=33922 RepID=A0ABX4H4D9_9BACT|nr:chromate transporter [Mycoplasmopsis agassizii]PAF54749.1 chromate transporter [Mycoplasmopsis agassizii]SMC20069.1 chromate transporter [Mycoplasmopsis agassizii]
MQKPEKKPKVRPKFKDFWQVFYFIQIVTFLGFGGGNALMPIIRKYSVLKFKWLSEEEFDKLLIVANMLPGPSVLQALTYIASIRLGKINAIWFVLIAVLPHVLLAVLVFYLFQFLPPRYLFVVNLGVLSAIIATLILFGWRYLKMSHKELSIPLWVSLFCFTIVFALFIPAPYNIAAIVMVGLIAVVFVIEFVRQRKLKKQQKTEKESKDK